MSGADADKQRSDPWADRPPQPEPPPNRMQWPDDHDLEPPAPPASNLLFVVVVSVLSWIVFCLAVRSCAQ